MSAQRLLGNLDCRCDCAGTFVEGLDAARLTMSVASVISLSESSTSAHLVCTLLGRQLPAGDGGAVEPTLSESLCQASFGSSMSAQCLLGNLDCRCDCACILVERL